jgi:hypothetical protein
MTIAIISKASALAKIREALHLPSTDTAEESTLTLVGQALRRTAHILAPCPRHELERAVSQALKEYLTEPDRVADLTTEALDALLAYGEIIEMRAPADDPWSEGRLIVRPAPPTFVMRPGGTAILLGVAGEEITPLPAEMNARIEWHGVLRTLAPDGSENLREFLSELGLLEMSERAWLRLPPLASAINYRAIWTQRLAACSRGSVIEGLQVIDSRKSPNFYKGRWAEPDRMSHGLHVGRRPQRYGAPLWCLVDLSSDGVPERFLDLSTASGRERSCDIGWRVQMALDGALGIPQRVRVRTSDRQSRLDFFSPIPSWAERKLAVVGNRTMAEHCLFSYVVPQEHTVEITDFLQSYLWVAPEAMSKGEKSR